MKRFVAFGPESYELGEWEDPLGNWEEFSLGDVVASDEMDGHRPRRHELADLDDEFSDGGYQITHFA